MTRICILPIVLAAACADPIGSELPDAAPPSPQTGKVRTTRDPSTGVSTTVVDATSMTGWTYADFETGGEVETTAPWDLRFQRFHISTNGGESGTGGVQVAVLAGKTFAQVTSAPASGYISDAPDANGDGQPEFAFEQGDGWYEYDGTTHQLKPRPNVYVVKTAGGATVKLAIVSYYDGAGTSGWLSLQWAAL